MTGNKEQPTEDTRTPEERFAAGQARARAQYADKPKPGSIPLASQLGPIDPTPHTKESNR